MECLVHAFGRAGIGERLTVYMPPVPFQIWQRDDLNDVLRVPELVVRGFRTDSAIAAQFGKGEDGRQGRYLVQAADIIGIIARPKRGRIVVTGLGKTLMGAPIAQRPDLIRQIVVDTPAARETLKILGRTPMTAEQMEAHFQTHNLGVDKNGKPYGKETLKRRVGPFLNTLASVGVATTRKNVFSRTPLGTSMLAIKPKVIHPGAASGTKRAKRTVNPARRKSVELAAMAFVENYYENVQKYRITRRYDHNCGYDIWVHDPLLPDPICVEIKGTSVAKSFIVYLSPNEYGEMMKNPQTYRVCVVMDALGSPDLREFFYETTSKCWIDADTMQRLVITTMTGAKLTV